MKHERIYGEKLTMFVAELVSELGRENVINIDIGVDIVRERDSFILEPLRVVVEYKHSSGRYMHIAYMIWREHALIWEDGNWENDMAFDTTSAKEIADAAKALIS